jgi:DNA mismatch repair protein MutS
MLELRFFMHLNRYKMTEIAQEQKITPMMMQWEACKKMSHNSLLFFRMGDFYEAFYDDATVIAKELELTLTSRQEIPMCGVPSHTCETHIDRLVAKGYRVALAEQMEDPRKTKGIVKREVVRIVTPGTVINSSLLSDKDNNYFASITRVGSIYGFAFLDLTTSEFKVIEFDQEQDLLNEIYRVHPSEFIISKKIKDKNQKIFDDLSKSYDFMLNEQEDWHFEHHLTYETLVNHFKACTLDGFGLKGMVAGINAAGALLNYLHDMLCQPIDHILDIQVYSTLQYMSLDRVTQRNLELTESLNDGSRKHTLLAILDKTCTPMGARLMRRWIKQPLLNVDEIKQRQDAVSEFFNQPSLLEKLTALFNEVRDLERLMMKISSGYASPRDIVSLRYSLQPIPRIKTELQSILHMSSLIAKEENSLEPLPELTHLIAKAIVDEPPARVSDGMIFRQGFHSELDELREISHDSKSWMMNYQIQLRESTGIKTLKVGYNKLSGYYIEVSRGQAEKMPDIFERRQTLVNAERFITPELKEYENKVLHAEEKILALENELFLQLRQEVTKYSTKVFSLAQSLAKLDCLISLAMAAQQNHYVRPIVDESNVLQIVEGRHPVIEAINKGEKFISNDTLLDDENSRLLLITGPNMAGKSTYIRQVALITIMAQMGSFIPAKSAQIGIVDKVFTRIGASDDLARGQSTFMVEMTETANILHNATSRSLVILDEIGRGTSTYDGISIAWSVAEFLLTADGKIAKTLFATHYWELTKLEEKVRGAVNYNVAVNECEDHIIFLRKIVRGGTDKSYGIHVGRLAGLPFSVIQRAKEILIHLEENANRKSAFEPSIPKRKPRSPTKLMDNSVQLTFFGDHSKKM